MTAAEVRVRAARLADALGVSDPRAIRATLSGITPIEANQVVRAAIALSGGRLRIG